MHFLEDRLRKDVHCGNKKVPMIDELKEELRILDEKLKGLRGYL